MYPTIELSCDQAPQFEGHCQKFQCQIPYLPLWGVEITRLAEKHSFKERGEWLVSQFKNYGVILTNPDISSGMKLASSPYRRRLYRDGGGRYHFLLDEYLGWEPRQIATPSLQEAMVAVAARSSFRETAGVVEHLTAVVVSAMTVQRSVQRVADLPQKSCRGAEYCAPTGPGRSPGLPHGHLSPG